MRRFWARHPRLADALLAAHVVPLLYSVISNDDPADWGIRALHLATLVAIGAALIYRRRAPVTVTAVAAAATTVQVAAGLNLIDIAALPVALYSLTVFRSQRAAWIAFGVTAPVSVACGLLTAAEPDRFALGAVFPLLLLVSILIGVNVLGRRRYTEALVALAARLARERDQQGQLAAAAERARIAREIHDIVAHSLTVVVALANGADAAVQRSPEVAQKAIREARDVGRNALTDMRRLLGVLREDSGAEPDERRPQPGSADLGALVESFRAAGLPVTLTVTGPAPEPSSLELTVHRIVQEALTNVLRYAHQPTLVSVKLRNEHGRIDVHIRDNGRGGPDQPSQGTGKGLIGMRERVAIYGGTLEVGPGAGGGWHVHAVLRSDRRAT